MPHKKPVLANSRINRATPARSQVIFRTYSLSSVEFAVMMTSRTLHSGSMTGESFSCPQPRERSFTAMPARAGSAIMNTMLTIMPMVSIWMVAPMRTLSVNGMENGESTVETRMALSPSAVLPENMPTHMKLTMPMGTLYSSRTPVMICVSPANRIDAMPNATTGMNTSVTPSMTKRGRGCRTVSASWRKVLLSDPWKVMKAKRNGTTVSMGPNTPGNRTPAVTQSGTMKGIRAPIAFPSRLHAPMLLLSPPPMGTQA